MYDDSITTMGVEELLKARLAQAAASLRGIQVTTREDLLATVYSALNAVLALGNNVTPLLPVTREGPAIRRRPQRQLPDPESGRPGHHQAAPRYRERRSDFVQPVRLHAEQPAADRPAGDLHLRIAPLL
jgi:hypothetical protein